MIILAEKKGFVKHWAKIFAGEFLCGCNLLWRKVSSCGRIRIWKESSLNGKAVSPWLGGEMVSLYEWCDLILRCVQLIMSTISLLSKKDNE